METSVTDEAYQKGLDALSSLISGRTRGDGKKWSHAFEMMETYLQRLGLDAQLHKLSVIHVAGTKGKGSTCAMVESMLRQCGYKTGLYTSPHLIDVRERIRINGVPVDKGIFLKNLWDTFRILDEKTTEDCGKPAYFRFLTLLAFRIFLETKVDVAILEVGLGGRLDATNCVRTPVVCGVTALGFDHMDVLGHTLPEIAREKAGIFKPGCPAFTIPTQRQDAMQMLDSVAQSVGTPLHTVPGLDRYRCESLSSTLTHGQENGQQAPTLPQEPFTITLGLAGEHQRENASLAIRLASEWEEQTNKDVKRPQMVKQGILPSEYARGLQSVRWPGRSQVISDAVEGLTFFLDGAHTPESMETCAEWYAGAISSSGKNHVPQAESQSQPQYRVLLFNCMSERDAESLLRPLQRVLLKNNVFPHSTFFVPPESVYFKVGVNLQGNSSHGGNNSMDTFPDLSWQVHLRQVWKKINFESGTPAPTSLHPPALSGMALPQVAALGLQDVATGAVLPSIKSALHWIRSCARSLPPPFKVQVLVTGSLYLVGDTLRLLDFKSGDG